MKPQRWILHVAQTKLQTLNPEMKTPFVLREATGHEDREIELFVSQFEIARELLVFSTDAKPYSQLL